jgi:hypothetical protein
MTSSVLCWCTSAVSAAGTDRLRWREGSRLLQQAAADLLYSTCITRLVDAQVLALISLEAVPSFIFVGISDADGFSC